MINEKNVSYVFDIIYKSTISKNKVTGKNIILMYHGVSNSNNKLCVNKELFKEQMKIIGKKYRIVSLSDLVRNLKKETKKNILAITFDDALKNLATSAIPVLRDMGYPATIFVPTRYVGGKNDWQTLGPNYSYEIMSFEEMRNNSDKLITYGSHGVSHRRLYLLDNFEIYHELVDSKRILEENLDQEIKFFAYPHGTGHDYDRRSIMLLRKVGYKAACTIRWGRFNSNNHIYELRRLPVRGSDSIEEFIMKLNGSYDWIGIKEKIALLRRSRSLSDFKNN